MSFLGVYFPRYRAKKRYAVRGMGQKRGIWRYAVAVCGTVSSPAVQLHPDEQLHLGQNVQIAEEIPAEHQRELGSSETLGLFAISRF